MGMDISMERRPDPERYPGETGYYRFRTPAMRAMVEAMRLAGVFDDEAADEDKFLYNDGVLVTPEECAIIAERIETYVREIPQADIGRVEEVFSQAEKALLGRFASVDAVVLKPTTTDVRLDRETLASWMLEWAQYNRVAVEHGGYRVR